jgi:predicted nucleic acid-binding protein
MIVVADTGPVIYLVLIEAVDVLKPLYSRVLLPQTVAAELQGAGALEPVRTWIAQPPEWCEIRPDPPPDASLEFLDPGERAAIALALSIDATRLLIDDWEGRAEAARQRLLVTGTLGVIAEAHRAGLLDFEAALARLRHTNSTFQRNLSIACGGGCPPGGRSRESCQVRAECGFCRRFARSRGIGDAHAFGVIHQDYDYVLLRAKRGHAQRRMPQQEQQQRHHPCFQKPDAAGPRAGQHPVIAADVPEQRAGGGNDGERQQPQGPRRQEDELTFMEQAGRIFEQKFEHEIKIKSRL